MAQFPTPFGGKLFIVYSEVFLYAKILHKCIVFQICSALRCFLVIHLSEVITYLLCNAFADPLENILEILQSDLGSQAEKLHCFPFCTLIHCSPQFVSRADPGDTVTNSRAYQHSEGTWFYLPKFPCSGLFFFFSRGNSKMLPKYDKFLLHKHCWWLRNRCDFCFRILGLFHC